MHERGRDLRPLDGSGRRHGVPRAAGAEPRVVRGAARARGVARGAGRRVERRARRGEARPAGQHELRQVRGRAAPRARAEPTVRSGFHAPRDRSRLDGQPPDLGRCRRAARTLPGSLEARRGVSPRSSDGRPALRRQRPRARHRVPASPGPSPRARLPRRTPTGHSGGPHARRLQHAAARRSRRPVPRPRTERARRRAGKTLRTSMLLLLALMSLACASPVSAPQEASTPRLSAPIRSVALFKNGYGYVRREVRVPAGTRALELELPVPALGTFTLSVDPALATIVSAIARRGEVPGEEPAGSLRELLHANVGREVTLELDGGAVVRGRLREACAKTAAGGYDPWQNDIVLVATAEGSVALRALDVRRVSAAELERRRTRPTALLCVTLEPHVAPEFALELTSLERGWSWSPSYALELDGERAHLAARAEVVAEAGELDSATVRFVTGFPNLRFAHVADPLALQGDLDAFLTALGDPPEERAGVARQSVMANFANNPRVDGAPPGVLPAELAGEEAGDLFISERENVSLRRGERALVALFQADVDCHHLYQWTIPAERPRPSGDDEKGEEIWHSVRLRNDTPQPWTTAPAMSTRGGLVLGQDVLHYAAAGASTTVRITRAIDVQGTRTEHELAREPDVRVRGRNFDRITVRGTLRVTNYERAPITLEVVRELSGTVKTSSPEARREVLGERPSAVNRHERLTWELTLEPGATRELVYEYLTLAD
ncbi:MAG: hypothetical protein EXS08_15910 [Planctomycetes bacterium]|nr:hypothetical protein [Planctomycetota bacterium]